jgi:hypothetical protein
MPAIVATVVPAAACWYFGDLARRGALSRPPEIARLIWLISEIVLPMPLMAAPRRRRPTARC